MTPDRKRLFTLGRARRRGYIRVFKERVDGVAYIRVQWTELPKLAGGKPRLVTESFEDSRKGMAEAKAFAEGLHDALTGQPAQAVAAPAPIGIRELYDAYATAKETEWSDNTLRLSRDRWGKFELFKGRDFPAQRVTREHLDELKKALLDAERAPNQVKHVLKEVVRVFEWGVDRDLIAPTKVTNYRIRFRRSAAAEGPQMAEYTEDERMRIVAAFDPRKKTEWRPWVANTLLAYCGPRARATLHLHLDDVRLDAPVFGPDGPRFGGMIRWRAETDKMAAERFQPMPEPVAAALWVALGWREYDRYTGPFIFYGAQRRTRGAALRRHDSRHAKARTTLDGVAVAEKPWTYSALNGAIRRGETKAGIAHIMWRSTHGDRRGVAGDIHAATGSEKTAADWIGDRSIKIVRDRYLLTRAAALQTTARLMEGETNRTEAQRARQDAEPEEDTAMADNTLHQSQRSGLNRRPPGSEGGENGD